MIMYYLYREESERDDFTNPAFLQRGWEHFQYIIEFRPNYSSDNEKLF